MKNSGILDHFVRLCSFKCLLLWSCRLMFRIIRVNTPWTFSLVKFIIFIRVNLLFAYSFTNIFYTRTRMLELINHSQYESWRQKCLPRLITETCNNKAIVLFSFSLIFSLHHIDGHCARKRWVKPSYLLQQLWLEYLKFSTTNHLLWFSRCIHGFVHRFPNVNLRDVKS